MDVPYSRVRARRRTRMLAAMTAALTLPVLAAPAADAATGVHWNCRASAVYESQEGRDRIEPFVANGNARTTDQSPDRAACADDEASGNELVGGAVSGRAPFARTSIEPDSGPTAAQQVTAEASLTNPRVAGSGTLVLVADEARSRATASCVNGVPALDGTSSVAGVTLNGQPLAIAPVIEQAGTVINGAPIGGLLRIRFNEQTRSGDTLVQRAIHVEVLDAVGALAFEAVVAESQVSATGAVCSPAATAVPGAGGDGGTGGTGGGSAGDGRTTGGSARNPCVAGATYDAERNLCVIERTGRAIIVVGRPQDGPSGGRVVPLGEVPKAYRSSPCLKGPGPKFAVLGTNKRDKVTGSNRADRILALDGRDKVGGGRGDDCLDGGAGVDTLSGSLGNDRLYGQADRDHIQGGSGRDQVWGGTGDDRINTDYGADLVDTGPGRDVVNAATAGPAARIRCGSGYDRIRVNLNERRRTGGCERVIVTR